MTNKKTFSPYESYSYTPPHKAVDINGNVIASEFKFWGPDGVVYSASTLRKLNNQLLRDYGKILENK